MAFNDLAFLFILFPVILLLHQFIPGRGKLVVLLLGSLLFYAWGNPQYLVLMVCSILFNYFSGLQMAEKKAQERFGAAKWVLISAVFVNLLLLGFFKYWGFLVRNVNAVAGTAFAVPELPLPIGISFFTFSILSYLFDVYRDKSPAAENVLEFALFVTFFPKLVSGPIVQYTQFRTQLAERKLTRAKFGMGCRLFLIGLAKKVLLSNTLGTTFYAVTALPEGGVSVITAWVGAICYALMLYFDFSGYSDMAIGLAQMFGFNFDKNFDYPYMSTSISEFWRRWHISLGAWFRDYIYFPLGGSRVGTAKTIRNLLVVWLCTGIWHGANWTFIVWGLLHGVVQIVEKFVLKNVLEKIPAFVKGVVTQLLVLIGWVFFFSDSLGGALKWLGCMFGIGDCGFVDSTGLYYLGGSAVMMLIGIFASFPVGARLGSNVYRKGKLPVVLSVVWFGVLLMLCIAGLMTSTYSTFLYAAF